MSIPEYCKAGYFFALVHVENFTELSFAIRALLQKVHTTELSLLEINGNSLCDGDDRNLPSKDCLHVLCLLEWFSTVLSYCKGDSALVSSQLA